MGIKVGVLVMSESGLGSDVVFMWMRVKEVDGGYVFNGSKMWIINGLDVDIVIVYVKIVFDGGLKGIMVFIVEMDKVEGFECLRKLDKMGMRGFNMGEFVFENVFVFKENVLGKVNGGVRVLMEGLDFERLVFFVGLLGLM